MRLPDLLFAAACAAAVVAWLVLGSGTTFINDEWQFIRASHDLSLGYFMEPHNEHLVALPKLLYQGLLATVGLHSYVPYLLLVVLLHVATAIGIYVYARRQTVPLIALAAGTLFLLLGSGAENLLWGFQVAFVGAAALGTWALVILLREPTPVRPWIAALLLLAAVATSGVGLFFLAAAAAILVISTPLRRHLWVLAPAVVAYAVWYLEYGGGAVGALAAPQAVVAFVRFGISDAVGELSGFGREIGLIIAVLIGIATVANLASGERIRLGLMAGAVGLLAQFGLTGLARADLGAELAGASRYTYEGAIFILIAFVGWIGHRTLAVEDRKLRLTVVVLGLAVVAIASNLTDGLALRDRFREFAMDYRAGAYVLTTYGGSPAIPADRGMVPVTSALQLAPAPPGSPGLLPGSAELGRLIERYGTPLEDPLSIRRISIPDRAIDRVFNAFIADSFEFTTAAMPSEPTPIAITSMAGLEATPEQGCLRVVASGGDAYLRTELPSGAALYLRSDSFGQGEVSLSATGAFDVPGRIYEAEPGLVTRVAIPDVGSSKTVHVEIRPAIGLTDVCMEVQRP